MEPIRIYKNEWWKLIEAIEARVGKRDLPLWSTLINYYGICIDSLVTPLSRTLWNMYQRINGTQNERYETYLELPAFWVDACDIVRNECARIDRIRQEQETRQMKAQMNRRRK